MTRDGAIDGSFTAPRSLTVGTGWGDSRSVLEAPDRHPLPGRQPLRRPPDHPGHGTWSTEFDRTDGVVADKASGSC
jgi:hypothetical protein